jgi:hypothetical protein
MVIGIKLKEKMPKPPDDGYQPRKPKTVDIMTL